MRTAAPSPKIGTTIADPETAMETVSTADVPANERFAFWRDVTSRTWAPLDSRRNAGLAGCLPATGATR